ncbi:MAG: homocysteine S-methyltransferase family protein, partial [Pseudomonadota bacterium]|nr:homocysteine S-methyltransferase family protein [Pseudomonadota bacterium]
AEYACLARDAGIGIIGGCCGTTPDHVAAMTAALRATPKRAFDSDAALAALGTPWKDMPKPGEPRPEGGAGRRARGRRRRGRD